MGSKPTASRRVVAASPSSPLATALKWIAAVSAVIALVLGLVEVTRTFSALGERSREVTELRVLAEQQRKSGDHAAAWITLGQAATLADEGGWLAKLTRRLDADRVALRRAQEDLAMERLRDARLPAGQKFADLVDPLIATLSRGLPGAEPARRADLLAFIGWGYFLKSRDGGAAIDPDQHYREAIQVDAGNVFAHAHRGHWIAWQRGDAAEAEQHFAAALASGRETAYVRGLQLAMIRNRRGNDHDAMLVRFVNQLRRNGEPVEQRERSDLFSVYEQALLDSDERFRRLVAAAPLAEQVATLRMLTARDFGAYRAPTRDLILAMLVEAAGEKAEALQLWRDLGAALGPDGPALHRTRVAEAIRRLSSAQ